MGSLFAEGRVVESGGSSVWGGLKIYFGQRDKSLIRRHREDDPPTTTQDNLQGIGNGSSSASVPAPSPTSGGGGGGGGT
jgi:hypothetical protein